MFFCSHVYTKVVDGYQYCEKCRKARAVPCPHIWVQDNTYSMSNAGTTYKKVIVQRCTKCGELKKFEMD